MTFLLRPIKRLWRLLPETFIEDAERFLYFRMPTLAAIAFCRWFRHRRRGEVPTEILVVRLDGLGDCVMTLPLLDELRRCYPLATISIAVQSRWATVFNRSPSVDQVLPLEASKPVALPSAAWNLYSCLKFYLRFLKGRRFDIVINPRWDADPYLATMLCALTLAPTTVGYEDRTSAVKIELNRGFEHAYTVVIDAGSVRHEVQHNLEVLRALGHEPRDGFPEIRVTEQEQRAAGKWIADPSHGFLVVFGLPAAGGHRRWDAAHFIELLRLLKEGDSFIGVMIADQATLAIAEAVQAAFPEVRIACGLPFSETAAIIAACDVYVGADSGLAHVAAALNRETVVISPHPLGADPAHHNSPARFRPYGAKAVVIQPRARRGCEDACAGPGPHCILDIDPKEVATAVLRSRRRPEERLSPA